MNPSVGSSFPISVTWQQGALYVLGPGLDLQAFGRLNTIGYFFLLLQCDFAHCETQHLTKLKILHKTHSSFNGAPHLPYEVKAMYFFKSHFIVAQYRHISIAHNKRMAYIPSQVSCQPQHSELSSAQQLPLTHSADCRIVTPAMLAGSLSTITITHTSTLEAQEAVNVKVFFNHITCTGENNHGKISHNS